MVKTTGVVENYRRSGAVQDTGYVIIKVLDGDAGSLVGGRATLKFQDRVFRGRILRQHGKGKVLARFNRNLPGQALGSRVELVK